MFKWFRKPDASKEDETPQEFRPAELPPRRVKETTPDWRTVLGRNEYRAEFTRLIQKLFDKFAIEDTPYDMVLESMNAIETELGRNGGTNWRHSDYAEHLAFLRDQLKVDPQFNEVYIRQIDWALDEIAAVGKELEEKGQSSRPVDSALDLLIARVVDWCRTHGPELSDGI